MFIRRRALEYNTVNESLEFEELGAYQATTGGVLLLSGLVGGGEAFPLDGSELVGSIGFALRGSSPSPSHR